ncbi:SpoIIIAC/SpoIIIAD family protein [Neglectibacter timonensis]|jgi:stage III sporulation protein AD|uniref:SpoIIIAC/SpoIIIAD family protein n=1 Tax=Neglectibacter timonensis TaxID=1776382 RepID=UPI00266DA551|nr:SpoIIIAC/SpoIIIAD family protein [Neglectibacter timonensis]
MEIFGISACVLCAVLFAAVVKKSNREYALLMTILTAILILLAVFQKVAPFLEEIEAIAQSESFDSSYLLVLLKAVGITLVGQTTSSLCKDAGESTLAFAVELASKAAILLVSLPVILKIFEYLSEILRI